MRDFERACIHRTCLVRHCLFGFKVFVVTAALGCRSSFHVILGRLGGAHCSGVAEVKVRVRVSIFIVTKPCVGSGALNHIVQRQDPLTNQALHILVD